MADQFCRIVDTTVTDATLGSDAEQSVLTTDSNTSFVVRNMYSTSAETNANLCSNIVATMDGHTIDTSQSFIVPPSSNLCVKDTSGNFPLQYSCLELFGHMCAGFCGSCNPVISSCTINSVTSGTPVVNLQLACCACCNIFCSPCNFDMHFFTTNRCALVHLRHNGNNDHCFRIYENGCNFPKYDNGTGYCPVVVSGGLLVAGAECCISVFNPEACSKVSQAQYFCCKTMCNFLADSQAPTSYARIGMSGQEHPTCEGCIAIVLWKGGAAACCTSFFAFNTCETGPCINSTKIWCKSNSNIYDSEASSTTCTGFNCLANSNFFLGAYYSARCSAFVAVAYGCDCISFALSNGSPSEVLAYNRQLPSTFAVSGARILVSQGKIWSGRTTNCQFISADLDDILVNSSAASVTCYYEYPSYTCITPGGAVVALKKDFPSPNPSNFTLDPTAKVTMYGIKST